MQRSTSSWDCHWQSAPWRSGTAIAGQCAAHGYSLPYGLPTCVRRLSSLCRHQCSHGVKLGRGALTTASCPFFGRESNGQAPAGGPPLCRSLPATLAALSFSPIAMYHARFVSSYSPDAKLNPQLQNVNSGILTDKSALWLPAGLSGVILPIVESRFVWPEGQIYAIVATAGKNKGRALLENKNAGENPVHYYGS